jgi:hypothetical protein
LQTCSTSEFVCGHACFCVYVYLWIYLPYMRENMRPLCFWSWLTSLNMMYPSCIHLPSNMSLFLLAEWNSVVCVYHIFLIHSSVAGHLVVSRAWLFWIVLWWTSVYRCLCGILTYVPLGRHSGVVVSLIKW